MDGAPHLLDRSGQVQSHEAVAVTAALLGRHEGQRLLPGRRRSQEGDDVLDSREHPLRGGRQGLAILRDEDDARGLLNLTGLGVSHLNLLDHDVNDAQLLTEHVGKGSGRVDRVEHLNTVIQGLTRDGSEDTLLGKGGVDVLVGLNNGVGHDAIPFL